MNNIFVGNLSFEATKEDVVKLFEPFGTVANAVIMERKKGKSRGYGFVDMPNEEEKNAAIAALQGKEFMWRVLSVSLVVPKVKSESKPKELRIKKKWNPDPDQPIAQKPSESKYYSKFDGPPKPWRKSNTDSKPFRKDNREASPSHGKKEDFYGSGTSKPSYKKFDGPSKPFAKKAGGFKPFRKDDTGSRPYYGKKDGDAKPGDKKESKPFPKREGGFKAFNKPSKGFKMLHKVSGASKTRPS